MKINSQRIEEIAQQIRPTRHKLHQHPEISFALHHTSALVADHLEQLGLEVQRGFAQTGLVAILRGRLGAGRHIAIRADMDALNIEEAQDHAVRSLNPGCSHACGHDGHTTIALATATYLTEHNDFAGTLYFVFQPAEEGEGGARVMIEEGLFTQFPIEAIYGLHNLPGMPLGHIATRIGPVTAASDSWEVEFQGSGGHGAMPEKVTDPTRVAAHFISLLPTISANSLAPTEPAVVSVGYLHAGDPLALNVIPDRVKLGGTARSFSANARDTIESRVNELAQSCAQAFHCQAKVNYIRRYPPTVNHEQQTQLALSAAKQAVGSDRVTELAVPFSFSEDFSYYLEHVSGCFAFIGNGEQCSGLHTPQYQFNDDAIETGMRLFIEIINAQCSTP